ncbi:DoxX family membrane protein [Mesorhizobium sp. B2-1-3A]|nr:DoxX family membrane protein [Mesorhizobium sp. B2-1-3A]
MIDLVIAPYAVLLIRLCLGVMFVAHAMLKWRVFTIRGTVASFNSWSRSLF